MPPGGPWTEWVGRTRSVTDRISLVRARGLAATLDRDPSVLGDGSVLPHGWHWVYFHSAVPRSGLADDGHEARGDFLPPVPLARRMWAGGRIWFHVPLRIGEEAVRTSTIERVTPKDGRSGPLVFITVSHRIEGPSGLAIHEEQDLVYRGAAPAGRGPGAVIEAPEGVRRLAGFVADAVTLFRFSALTFNSHRIHYDHPYATEVEGYPGLVVHGPLVALLLLEAGIGVLEADSPGAPLREYGYRALAPLFCGELFDLVTSGKTGEAVSASRSGPKGDPLLHAAGGEARTPPPAEGGAPGPVPLWAVHARRGVAMEATVVAAGARASPS